MVRHYPKNKPFVYKNNINLNISNVNKNDRSLILSRLANQLDDSSKVRVKDAFLFLHYKISPPVFDTASMNKSAQNMEALMVHLGYYNSKVSTQYKSDTVKKARQIRVTTTYNVNAGPPTLIDTFAYIFNKPDLEQLAETNKKAAILKKNIPITRAGVSDETQRLVDLFRNNGYYKITNEELKLTGDTTIEALTTISDNPFEQVRLLAEAAEKRKRPTIKLAMVLNAGADSTRLNKFYVDKIYVLPDYQPGDNYLDTTLRHGKGKNMIIKYHQKKFEGKVLARRVTFKKGQVYSQNDYYQTIDNLYKLNIWQSPVIDIIEHSDTNLVDIVVKLTLLKSYGIEGTVEASYSANSNTSNTISSTNSGNLLGVSGNLTFLVRNFKKQAKRLSATVHSGVEFNTSGKNSNGTAVNSTELSFSGNLISPNNYKIRRQSITSVNFSQINRVDFFNQQVINASIGWLATPSINRSNGLKGFVDFRRIYNRTQRFDSTLEKNPYLRYSFNTALVFGPAYNYTFSTQGAGTTNKKTKTFRFNGEASLPFKTLFGNESKTDLLSRYLKEYVKADIEFIATKSIGKSVFVKRLFLGVGIPYSKTDTTLPFFKQYYGGGPSSMRGWPVRGIGVGGQSLPPYNTHSFNDRTGDIQLEGNIEYRHNIAPLFGSGVTLKGALFMDVGNIWNFKNTKPDGSEDSTQFKFKNLYKQLGVSAGYGFRIDFSYFLIRLDFGFRFKRPDVPLNDGWQFPSINLQNIFGNSTESKRWRYENYNFTIGIDYPF